MSKKSKKRPRDEEDSCFATMEVRQRMTLLPSYIGRVGDGVLEHLNDKVLRYSRDLGGVLLSYSKPRVLQNAGAIIDEHPHTHFDLQYTAHVFRPRVGSVLCGVVNNIGDDHIGCLVYDCFNASVVTYRKSENRTLMLNYEIGNKIHFCVTQVEIVAGILSIRGELMDDSSSSIRHHRKRHKSGSKSLDETEDNIKQTPVNSTENCITKKKKKKKKSKHKD